MEKIFGECSYVLKEKISKLLNYLDEIEFIILFKY